MQRLVTAFAFAAALSGLTAVVSPAAAYATAKVGEPAPAFTGHDSHGKDIRLADLKGKYVVLEWHNQGCPFVKKHYNSGNMQALQKEWTGKGVTWLTVISSAQGQQGYVSDADENKYLAAEKASPTAAILDPKGEIGNAYGAKTTPHMFIIDPQGKLIYAGAIDDRPSPDAEDIKGAKNYVSAALTEAMAGKPVSKPITTAYGCSVKYAH